MLDTMEQVHKAHAAALKARANAHAPYSNFRVGAAVLLPDGSIFSGCNMENASYGGTICAERNAFAAAVANRGGKLRPAAVVIITEPAAVPCGFCLQVMAEFCSPDMPVYLGTAAGPGERVTLRELLPRPFSPESLK